MAGKESTADREIVTTRLLKAPRELVFAALTDPAHIGEWWGPDGFRTVVEEMDVRPGGTWRFMMHGPDGTDYPNLCTYTEVVKPERIAFEHSSDDPNDPRRFLSEITLEDRGGDTLLTMRARFLTVAARDYVLREHHAAEGGKQTLARLAKYLSA